MRVAVFAFLSVALVSTKAQAPDRVHHVEYRVTGSGKVSINCTNATGGTEQRKAKLPWSLTFDANNGTFLYLSAQKSGWRGSIRSEIFVDSVSLQYAESNDSMGIASVQGT